MNISTTNEYGALAPSLSFFLLVESFRNFFASNLENYVVHLDLNYYYETNFYLFSLVCICVCVSNNYNKNQAKFPLFFFL